MMIGKTQYFLGIARANYEQDLYQFPILDFRLWMRNRFHATTFSSNAAAFSLNLGSFRKENRYCAVVLRS